MANKPEPREMTAEEIRDHLIAGDEVWLWEKDRPRHRVYSVEPLTADQVRLGADYQVYFQGALTGRMLPKHVSQSDTLKAVARKPPKTDGEPDGQIEDAEDSRG